jgi:hypothetical protein
MRSRAWPTVWRVWPGCSGRRGILSRVAGTCSSRAATMPCSSPISPSSRWGQSLVLTISMPARIMVTAASSARRLWPPVTHGACSGVRRAIRRQRCCCRTRERLIARRIRPFDESNWWQWGRGYHQTDQPRVYVNNKTRRSQPFFVHPCKNYDGSVLAIFAHDPTGRCAGTGCRAECCRLGRPRLRL